MSRRGAEPGPRSGGAVSAGDREQVGRLEAYRRAFDERLSDFLAGKRREVPGGDGARDLVDAVSSLVEAGGKRLRPALVHHAYRAGGGRDPETVRPLELATELLHTYLLIHDDVMDRSGLRRGAATVHARFGERHRRDGGPGDPEHFGRSVAILAGDLAHGWAVELVHRVPGPEPRRRELERRFSAMCEEVVCGQYLETLLPGRAGVSEEDLLEVQRLKSGRYSVERPVELGTCLAGAPSRVRDALARYARAVGEAFQLQDDLIGTLGDARRAGKPGGSDLVEGKLTLLVHHALEAAGSEEERRLRRTLRDPSPEPAAIEAARELLWSTGAVARVRSEVDRRLSVAEAAIREAGLEEQGAREFFLELLETLRGRDR